MNSAINTNKTSDFSRTLVAVGPLSTAPCFDRPVASLSCRARTRSTRKVDTGARRLTLTERTDEDCSFSDPWHGIKAGGHGTLRARALNDSVFFDSRERLSLSLKRKRLLTKSEAAGARQCFCTATLVSFCRTSSLIGPLSTWHQSARYGNASLTTWNAVKSTVNR